VNWTLALIAFCGIVFVASAVILVVCLIIGLARLVAAWRREPAHAYHDPEPAEKWLPEVFGSMDLETDRALGGWKHAKPTEVIAVMPPLADQLEALPGWRKRTAAELAPDTLATAHEEESSRAALTLASAEIAATHPEPAPEPEPEAPAVESRAEWLRRLQRDAAPGWTFAGGIAA
jgi:hypothetical protein